MPGVFFLYVDRNNMPFKIKSRVQILLLNLKVKKTPVFSIMYRTKEFVMR